MPGVLKLHVLGALGALLMAVGEVGAAPHPTVLSTDIGGDIDDTWALAHLLRSPELDLDLVLTETGESRYRAMVAAKFLEVAQRTDVTVALGVDFGVMSDADRHQGPWVQGYDLDAYPGQVAEDGVQAFIDYVRAAEGTVTVIAIGPAPSVAAAVQRAPDIARKCRLLGMHGSFDIGYGGKPHPDAEYNVKADVAAFRALMAAPWQSIALTPLDTCGLVALDGENYHRVWRATDDPLARAVIENYCLWAPRQTWLNCDFFAVRSTTLFDNVAIYMAYADAFLEYEEIAFEVTDEGFTVRDPDGPYRAQVAVRWRDLPGFYRHLTQRLVEDSTAR
ncbi:nucleoside hydrolase [Synoicihabitans lomoniglobus]|uniref:Nucleoside hydrolase n=1 Tax=Synoicihabitans lomoniglobus TaxID=2909285 RepID=A0AAE9ZUV4_9BACT|nr:nucleoside hydrolase [Opitutaceae bacterium LMO-M01]WED64651.1 nucleoside hydrolase [Opitutaceae bacterium LMO-M01]